MIAVKIKHTMKDYLENNKSKDIIYQNIWNSDTAIILIKVMRIHNLSAFY